MGERTGLGLVECTILDVMSPLGPRAIRVYRKNAKVLAAVEDRIGLAPGYAYEVLLDLARPWMMPVRLVDGQGNMGSRGNDPAANPPYTESRPSRAGLVALAAERGDLAPVPLGLINGNTYRKGTRPPFRPQRIIEALRQVIRHPGVSDQEIIGLAGPPFFLNGCSVAGDFAALAAGRAVVLRLEARVTISEDRGSVLIENFPPNANPDDAAASIASRARAHAWAEQHPELHRTSSLPMRDLRDESSRGRDLVVCVPERGTAPEELRDRLLSVHGVYTSVPARLPRPLPAMIRGWAGTHGREDVLTSLTALEGVIPPEPG